MSKSTEYFLLFKTADAEKRAWKKLSEARKSAIFPILEMTRGRKIKGQGKNLSIADLRKTKGIYSFDRNWETSINLLKDCPKFFIDLTREPSLSCFEIENLSTSTSGYKAWTDHVISQKIKYPNILPSLIINPSEDEDETKYFHNLSSQFKKFSEEFDSIAYRVSVLEDEDFLEDLVLLKPQLVSHFENDKEFFVILDHEYIRPKNGAVHAPRTTKIITEIQELLPQAKLVCMATSFPKSVTDVGDEEHDFFRVEEMYLFDKVSETTKNILYGDYGSINPIRNDEIIITQGWRPRIDFVSSLNGLNTYYYREKRKVVGKEKINVKGKETFKNILAPYSTHYTSVANSVIHSELYENLSTSWGNEQIREASRSSVPSNSPSHWISVRMEIHIIQILKHLLLDP